MSTSKPRVAVVDYGSGNLWSVAKALEQVADGQFQIDIHSDAHHIVSAHRVVVPGQGAARDCMRALQAQNLDQALRQRVANNLPTLGICMGLQLMFGHSEENAGTECLGLWPGAVRRFERDPSGQRKVPHMGWNRVKQTLSHPLWSGIEDLRHFYFAHSYYVQPATGVDVAAVTEYGHEYCSAATRSAMFACQFHPEKSGSDGLQLLRNFLHWQI